MHDMNPQAVDIRVAHRYREAAARQFDAHAFLYREAGARLLARLDWMQLAPARVIDLGAGTGETTRALARRYRRAQIIGIEESKAMLARGRSGLRRLLWRPRYLLADPTNTGLEEATADLVFCNLLAATRGDPVEMFRECRRILRPRGLLLFSTAGPSTLKELRAAWASVDTRPHVQVFLDMHDVGDALIAAGFSSPVMERENLSITYRTLDDLVRDLRGMGARNSHPARARGLYGRNALKALREASEAQRVDGRLSATCELIFGHAWAPTRDTRPQDGSTVATFPVSQLGRRPAP